MVFQKEDIALSEAVVKALPYILTSRDILITTSTKTKRKLFVQRSDAFTLDLVSLLHDMLEGKLVEISFRNTLLGDFILSRSTGGMLQGHFAPVDSHAADEFHSRVANWMSMIKRKNRRIRSP